MSHLKLLRRLYQTQIKQIIYTTVLTVILIACGCAFVVYIRIKYGTIYSALAVSTVNSGAPSLCGYLVKYESHAREGSRQASLYFKITAFLWITTAMLTAMITPFVETLNNERDSLIPAMYAIFITEMLKTPVTQLLDISGHVYRHVLAPRAKDQKRMSNYFKGKAYNLSERYTNLTNVLFLTFYYALLFPAGFFLASATLAVHYWTDKFCLLRVWAPAPLIGNKIADMSRTYFFSTALVVYALVSSHSFASFPYDNACGRLSRFIL
jgi:diacylglycerol kinase